MIEARKPHRPTKQNPGPKGNTPKITLVMDPKDRDEVKTFAAQRGMTLADFIRTAITHEMNRQKLGT